MIHNKVKDSPYLSYRDEPRTPRLRSKELADAIGFVNHSKYEKEDED